MSPLEVLKLVGYSTGAALHLWVVALLWRRRRNLGILSECCLRLPSPSAHGTRAISHSPYTICSVFKQSAGAQLRICDTIACISITLAYSLLLHVHLHLWADAQARKLTTIERARVFLTPGAFLFISVPQIWRGLTSRCSINSPDFLSCSALISCRLLCLGDLRARCCRRQ
jgi:hypothetical protein